MTQNAINSATQLTQFLSTSSTSTFDLGTTMPVDDTIPQKTEGDEILTLAITPTKSTSTLIITYFACAIRNGPAAAGTFALFQDTTSNALSAVSNAAERIVFLKHIMTSGTTSSTTFKIRGGPDSAAHVFVSADTAGTRKMGGVSYTNLTIEEYV